MSTHRTVLVLAVAGLTGAAGADVISSSFDATDEGWLVADGNSPDNQSVTALPDHELSGGNENGFITTPITWPTTAFFVAPNKFLGDRSDMFGGRVDVDRRFVHPDSWADTMQVDYAVDLTMSGLDGAMTLAAGLDPVSLIAWNSFSVALDMSGGWVHLDSGVAATDAEIASLLGDLEDIRVRGNVRDSFGRIGIDNFSLVPAPGGAALFALGMVAALVRRR